MDNPKYYANITAKYKDSNSEIRFSDFKSKKKGSTFNQLFGGIVIAGYQSLTSEKVQEWWDKGLIEKNIKRLREMDIESEGENGLSKTDALRLYKVILSKIDTKNISNPIITFDGFTKKELGMEKKKI